MTYKNAIIKLRVELLIMFPFVLLGKLYGRLFPYNNPSSIFLFFPWADIGGATKVNADIIDCVADMKPLMIFSKKPRNNGYKHLFYSKGLRIIDLHKRIDNKYLYFINFFCRGVLASWINRCENPIVFGGESMFFYKIIPHIRKDIPCIELSHLDTWVPYNIAFIDCISYRLCSTLKLKEKITKQYDANDINPELYKRVHFIENTIDIPEYVPVKNEQLEVVFIGRGSAQKRPQLTAAIAKKMYEEGLPVHFSFVGDVEKMINPDDFPFCTFYGSVTDEKLMNDIYQKSDVLILTSDFEGLPLVVMQMMVRGKVVVSTAVNAIPDYIFHGKNGLLIYATEEDKIIEEGAVQIRTLINNPALKEQMGKASREIGIERFNKVTFCNKYRQILSGKFEFLQSAE